MLCVVLACRQVSTLCSDVCSFPRCHLHAGPPCNAGVCWSGSASVECCFSRLQRLCVGLWSDWIREDVHHDGVWGECLVSLCCAWFLSVSVCGQSKKSKVILRKKCNFFIKIYLFWHLSMKAHKVSSLKRTFICSLYGPSKLKVCLDQSHNIFCSHAGITWTHPQNLWGVCMLTIMHCRVWPLTLVVCAVNTCYNHCSHVVFALYIYLM